MEINRCSWYVSLRLIIITFLEFHLRTIMIISTFISPSCCGTWLSTNIIIWTSSHRRYCWTFFCSSLPWSFSSFYLWNNNWRFVLIGRLVMQIFSRLLNWWFISVFFSGSLFLIKFHFLFMLFKLSHLFCFLCGSFGELLLELDWI